VEKIFLASASPRRRELLERIGYTLVICPSDIDETPLEEEDAVDFAERMAAAKAAAQSGPAKRSLLISADTVVHIDGEILGKPKNQTDAVRMLERLSGRTHTVTTGVCVGRALRRIFSVSTQVCFRHLKPEEIQAYVATGEPMDKAGAYGIQGQAAGFVLTVDGSYTNVVGLPLAEVVRALTANKCPPPFCVEEQ
jgi:septum formation protein